MQNAYQTYFKDRALFDSTFPIREQAPKGNEWDFKLNHIYTVALLNFSMKEDAFDKEKIRHHVQLCDTATHKVFYDKLDYIYVEISKFNKTLEELDTLYEKWLYALKNLYKLTQRPKELCDNVFKFNKSLEQLDTLYEKWLYALKNLYKLTQRPKELCDKVFDRLFSTRSGSML